MENRIVVTLVVALMAYSCANNEIDSASQLNKETSPEFYSALSDVTNETKTYVDSDLNLRWTADDRISIFTNTYNQEYKFTGSTGSSSGAFIKVAGDDFVTGNSIDRNYAVYPYREETELFESGKMTVTLPSEQVYAKNTFGLGANTMVAVTSGTSDYFLPFKNLCGYLVVKLYGDATVKSITVKGNNAEKISGTASLTPQYGEAPLVTVSNTGAETITVSCGDGVTLGSTKETATSFWLVVPPVTFSKGFTITVTDSEGKTMEKSTTSSKTIKRNVKNSMAAFEAKFEDPEAEHEYIDLGLSVKWATCNLGATKPEEYGTYYAWGDVVGQTWNGSSWSGGGFYSYPEYELDSYGNLKLEYDAARANLGGSWRIPTHAEQRELIDNCTSVWTSDYNGTGVAGRIFTSNKVGYTDKSIFLPAGGDGNQNKRYYAGSDGNYWTSTFNQDKYAREFFFRSDTAYITYDYIRNGEFVRPIYGEYIPVASISLSKTSVNLFLGSESSEQLTVVSRQPENASCFDLSWSSSDEAVATVSDCGLVKAVQVGTCTITASVVNSDVKAECVVTVKPVYVDLGLSVKWAACNLGAVNPEEYGAHYAYGDVVGQTWNGSKWSGGGFSASGYELDDYGNFKPEYDAANVKYGDSWRVPHHAELQELIDNCTSIWTNDYNGTGVAGRIFTSNREGYTDKSIFLPAAGYGWSYNKWYEAGSDGYYWISSSFDGNVFIKHLNFDSKSVDSEQTMNQAAGMSVRPVYGEYIPVTSISLSGTNFALFLESDLQLTVTHKPENASCFDLSWASSDEGVATVSADGLVTAHKVGSCTITASVNSNIKAECAVTVEPGYVDLGLSVKWATCAVGATTVTEHGNYYTWADACYESDNSNFGWGSGWRMPTRAEYQELIDNCTWTCTSKSEFVSGYLTSKINGNIIYLGATGLYYGGDSGMSLAYEGFYWTSERYDDGYAYCMRFWNNGPSIETWNIYTRMLVRLVRQ